MDDSRRKFCQAAGVALAGSMLPLQVGCLGTPVAPDNPLIDTMLKPGDVALDDAEQVMAPDEFIYLCHDANGFYAMSAYCTHAHCVIAFTCPMDGNMDPLGFLCSCHNSQYDFNGTVVTPPAPKSLPHYKVTLKADGTFQVDVSQVVDPSTRLQA